VALSYDTLPGLHRQIGGVLQALAKAGKSGEGKPS
jgi:hypothetical protein